MRIFGLGLSIALALPVAAQTPENGGPYNASFTAAGQGIVRDLGGADALVAEGAPYSIAAWVKPAKVQPGPLVLVALGEGNGKCRCLTLFMGHPMVLDGPTTATAKAAIPAGEWTHVAMVSDGATLRLYVGGKEAGSIRATSGAVPAKVGIAPVVRDFLHFEGALVDAKLHDTALSGVAVKAIADNPPAFAQIAIEAAE